MEKRTRKKWLPLEAERCLVLIANGYEKEEIKDHMARDFGSQYGLLRDMETNRQQLLEKRGLSRKEILQRKPLPPYSGPEQLSRSVYADFPWLRDTPRLIITEGVTVVGGGDLPLVAGD